jgi:hypothetical protein
MSTSSFSLLASIHVLYYELNGMSRDKIGKGRKGTMPHVQPFSKYNLITYGFANRLTTPVLGLFVGVGEPVLI